MLRRLNAFLLPALAIFALTGNCLAQADDLEQNIPSTPKNYAEELQKAENKALQAPTVKARLAAQADVAKLQRLTGNTKQAELLTKKCIAEARASGMKDLEARSLIILGHTYMDMGSPHEALAPYREALEINERIGNSHGVIKCLNNIAVVYVAASMDRQAIEMYEKALRLSEAQSDKSQKRTLLNNIGSIYRKQDKHDLAKTYYEKALKSALEDGHERDLAMTYRNLGKVAAAEKNTQLSIEYFQKAMNLYSKLGDLRHNIGTGADLSKALIKASRSDEAIERIETSKSLLPLIHSPVDLSASLSEQESYAYQSIGEHQKALDSYIKFHKYYVEDQERKNKGQLKELSLRFDLEQKEKDLELLRQKASVQTITAEKNRLIHYIIIATSIFCGVGLSVFMRHKLITERRQHDLSLQARESAECSSLLKTRLLRMAAHDLKSPLSVINSASDLIRETKRQSNDVVLYCDTIRTASTQIHTLLEDLLAQSCTGSQELKITIVTLDLHELAREITSYMTPLLSAKGQRIRFADIGALKPVVRGDTIRIWQVLENLISNASKFSPHGTQVTILFKSTIDTIQCGIRDEGPGVSPDEAKDLFKPFARGRARPTGGEKSTGLGLSLASEIMHQLNGKLWIESPASSKGSIFWISLPTA